MSNFQPVIKWSGSKRSQVNEIIKHFPNRINVYYEPFCGGASIMRGLMESDIKVKQFIISDLNEDLINLWKIIQTNPQLVFDHYNHLWHEMNDKDDNKLRKRLFFEEIRERYNKERNPLDFMFIMRTTTNGMPRYNNNGAFNNSFHIKRNGIIPENFKPIIFQWNKIINDNNVEFKCCSYNTIQPNDNDFVYLDPPYANTKGMYFGRIDINQLFDFCRNLTCSYALSFDGISGKTDNTYKIPDDIYDEHFYIKSGNSSFKRIKETDKNALVLESLYYRY